MSTSELPNSGATQPTAASSHGLLLTTFIAAIFVSAALLFAVQPMFTKMVLPQLGGAASVWSVAMVFFQTTLLAGYAYAHLLTRLAPGKPSVIIHLIVMASACLLLPLHIVSGWGRPPQVGEAFWLIGLFAVSIGLPFFALSANGPLLQAWFVRTGHPDAKDPYFLYAASNVGSFLALLAYPLVIEPFVRLGDQTRLWTAGYYLLILLVAVGGVLMLRSPNRLPQPATNSVEAAQPTWRDVSIWIALAAVPSGLLIAVTAHIATDVASVPLFWTVPLAIYLLTFVIVFQGRPLIPHSLVVAAQPAFVLFLVVAFLMIPVDSILLQILIHLGVFFTCALMCHGELARRRPPPQFLTGYYMWISFGGMIGGIVTGLIAPQVFTRVVEYPLLLVLALLCRPGAELPSKDGGGRRTLAALVTAAVVLFVAMAALDIRFETALFSVFVGFLLGLTVHFWKQPLAFATIVGMLFLVNQYNNQGTSDFLVRNFFGVLNVAEETDGHFRVLYHGSTAQGAQRIRDADGNLLKGRPDMVSEFHDGGGIAQVVAAVRARVGGPIDMAVIGLGTGALACRGGDDDRVTFYELDADIARIARDPTLFNYISECKPKTPIIIGDARLTLGDAKDGSYDLLFVDAFIGAAIPIHLLTREALALYFKKLKPHGVVAMHVSNFNLELHSVVAGIAQANGATVRYYNGGDIEVDESQHRWIPKIALVARDPADFGTLAQSEFWPIIERDPSQRIWTDDYSNIVGAMIRRIRERQQSVDEE